MAKDNKDLLPQPNKAADQSPPPTPAQKPAEESAPERGKPTEYPLIMDRPPGVHASDFRPGAMSAEEKARYDGLVAEKVAIGLPADDARQSAWRQIEHDRPAAKAA